MLLAAVSGTLVSCGSSETEKKVEKVTYTLDASKSTLKWKGSMSPEYFHEGTVAVTEGKLDMEGDSLVGGSFTIDMNSIAVTDAALPEEKKMNLVKHFNTEDFFNSPKFPKVTVTVSGYNDGKLSTTINILGQDIKQDIAVELKSDEKGATLTGKFDIDFESLKLTGMAPDPETGERVQPIVSYDMNIVLKK